MTDKNQTRWNVPAARRWLDTVVTAPILAITALAALTSCGKDKAPEIPSVFEVTGKTVINGETIVTARDTGTGCEVIITPNGVMPRNERSVDGASVKQRCVLTGTESSAAPGVTTTTIPADPAQTSAMDSQAAAVADTVREAIAPAPTAREIPPPAGKGTKPRAVPLPTRPAPRPTAPAPADGVETQMKN